MLTRQERVDIIKKIDFGEIDGSGDPNLEKYFLDYGYWDTIVSSSTFFVIGRKGTGKSSIYRMIAEQGIKKGAYVENKDFGDFPFHKLLNLSDDNFSMPNQYQSIWKNLILNQFAAMIEKQNEYGNIYYDQIKDYVDKCIGSVIDLHKEIVNYTRKIDGGLNFYGIKAAGGVEKAISIGNGLENVTQINNALLDLITNYLTTQTTETSFIIQFDRLDDNYNQYQDTDKYYQAIISLFKVVYSMNQMFRLKKIFNAKIILYLRSDIYRELGNKDAESARWDSFKFDINWAIINKDDWINPKLLQMINKRIETSLIGSGYDVSFTELFPTTDMNIKSRRDDDSEDVFQYIILRTMHRPRDLVQFCKYIKKEVEDSGLLNYRTIKNAEKSFTDWLIHQELANEINPVLHNTEALYDMLKLLGSKSFSKSNFMTRYRSVEGIDMKPEKLMYYLYDIGIFQNIEFTNNGVKFRSIIRNEGKLDPNQKLIIHTGVWRGLNV